MKPSTIILILLGALALVTAVTYVWLWFMIRRPERWATWVDRENDFWVRKGFISVSFAEQMKRIEKGMPQKILVSIGALLGTGGFLYIGCSLVRSGLLAR